MEWNGARVVITGGASGIGFALAQRAAQAGAIVRIVDIDAVRASEAAAKLGGTAGSAACDVGNPDAVKALAAALVAELGGIDVVFANAGVAMAGKLENLTPANADWVLSVNFMGIVNTARAFVPHLRASAGEGRDARIVITGSEHSLGIPTIGAANVYTSSKHGALGLADVLRSDLAGSGVSVSLLCPGLVATNIYDSRVNRPDRFGGAEALPEKAAEQVKSFFERKGQDPALTAQLCFEALDRKDFLIITDPHVGTFARPRLAEIEAAISLIEKRLSPEAS